MAQDETKYSSIDHHQQDRQDPSDFLKAMISIIRKMLKQPYTGDYGCITCFLINFLDDSNVAGRLEILMKSRFIEYLLKLHTSKHLENRKAAEGIIPYILRLITDEPNTTGFIDERASVVLKLCLSLRENRSRNDVTYQKALRSLRYLVEKGNYVIHLKYGMDIITQIQPIITDVVVMLKQYLQWSINSPTSKENSELFLSSYRDFKAISRFTFHAIQELNSDTIYESNCEGKLGFLYCLFHNMLAEIQICLKKLPLECLYHKLTEEGNIKEVKVQLLYLGILGELNSISKLYDGAEKLFWNVLKHLKFTVRQLVVEFANTEDGNDYEWLIGPNDITDCESRMHLAMVMIPGVKSEPDEELIEKLIYWSRILDPDLFVVVKDKKLTDHREFLHNWLYDSCRAIFTPENPIFLASPDESLSFYLKPEFNPKPFHYECVEFVGGVIALALLHKLPVGIALGSEFLLQLEESKHILVPFFARGFSNVLGISTKELLSFRGLKIDDINEVLCGAFSHPSVKHIINGKHERKTCVDPLFYQYQNIKKLGRNIESWQKGKKLGSGSFGEVYKGLVDPEGFLLAAKEVPLTETHKVSSIKREMDLLCQLHHENIVEYYGTKKEGDHLHIFLEFVNGGSLDNVYEDFILNESLVSCYTKQILEGLKYLHERKIMHGDIKCANILLNDHGCVKIADFGLAKVTELRNLHKSSGGTPTWPTSEVRNSRIQEELEADIWSLGCTVLEMLIGEPPTPLMVSSIPSNLSKKSQDFIRKCLQDDAKERPTAAELLEDPFIKTA